MARGRETREIERGHGGRGRWSGRSPIGEPVTERKHERNERRTTGPGADLREQIDRQLEESTAVTRTSDAPAPLRQLALKLGVFRVRGSLEAAVGDIAVAIGLFALTAGLASGLVPGLGSAPVGLDSPVPWIYALTGPLILAAMGGYVLRARLPGADLSRFGRLLLASTVTAWVTSLLAEALGEPAPLGQLFVVSLVLPVLGLVLRFAVEHLPGGRPDRIVIVGTGSVARRVGELAKRDPSDYDVVGYVEDRGSGTTNGDGAPPVRVLGGVGDLPSLLEQHAIDRVVVAFPARDDEDLVDVLRCCDDHAVDVDIVPRFFEFAGLEPCVSAMGDLPITHVRAQQSLLAARFAKRAFDVVVAGLLLLFLSPVLIASAVAIVLDSGRPTFYRQRRIGRCGKPFDILKFRSMIADADKLDASQIEAVRTGDIALSDAVNAIKGERDPRVTKVGAFLRKTSLDELPQLWNVVRGDMSLVGPRPLRPFEVEQLHAWQLVRQRVRPGITGLWQVLGRSELGWDERMALDYAYVRHWSPVSDLRILAETVPAVMQGEGAR